jgi:hypothetical protein
MWPAVKRAESYTHWDLHVQSEAHFAPAAQLLTEIATYRLRSFW